MDAPRVEASEFEKHTMLIRTTPAHRPERRGIVLLAVLVVVVLLSLAAYQYSDLMLSEYKAVVNAHRSAQARAYADSGIHYAAALISNPDNIATLGGNIYDNPDAFRDVAVGDDGKSKAGRFSLIAAPDSESGAVATWRHGFTDEAGKINVNAFMKRDPSGQQLLAALLKLPNMNQELAASIVDWLDTDSETTNGGAENDYYSAAELPYRCKNGPIDSIGELLLVKGMTRELLYGTDLNGNGIQDADEQDANGFSRGLAAFLTVYSREQNADAAGQALTFINETDLNAYYEKLATTEALGENMTKFLIMYRQYGASNSTGQQQSLGQTIGSILGAIGGKKRSSTAAKTIKGNLEEWTPDFEKKANQKISSFFDLINAQVSIPGKSKKDANGKSTQAPATVYDSPLKDAAQRRELFPKLFEHATIFEESDIPARINVNTAPREVLLAVPEISESDVEAIVQLRPDYSSGTAPAAIFDTPAWLLTEANLTTDTLKKLEKYVTTKSQVYRVQALGYADGAGPSARIEAVIDTNQRRPRILMWRDLTELGAGRVKNP